MGYVYLYAWGLTAWSTGREQAIGQHNDYTAQHHYHHYR